MLEGVERLAEAHVSRLNRHDLLLIRLREQPEVHALRSKGQLRHREHVLLGEGPTKNFQKKFIGCGAFKFRVDRYTLRKLPRSFARYIFFFTMQMLSRVFVWIFLDIF